MEQLIAEHTGQPLEKVAKDTDRDFILTAEEAVEYGVVDEVITSRKITPGLAAVAARGFVNDLPWCARGSLERRPHEEQNHRGDRRPGLQLDEWVDESAEMPVHHSGGRSNVGAPLRG